MSHEPNKPLNDREFWGRPVIALDKLSPKDSANRRRVNPEMIILARELRGITQADLAEQINATQGKISKIEDGFLSVSPEDLQQMSLALNLSRGFFFRQDVKRTVFNSFYRRRNSLPKKLLIQLNARVCLRQAQIDRLLRRLELPACELPVCDPDAYNGGPREIALLVRQFFRLPAGPVKNLVPALEEAGVVVVMFDFGTPKLDGLSIFTESRTPVIFVNAALPPSRRRLALVLELAHLVMHRLPRPNPEEEAKEFAAEFLMPEPDIAPDFATVTNESLALLKIKWGMAIAELLERAETLRLVSRTDAARLWAELAERGYRAPEPHEEVILEARPSLERKLIEMHLNELGFTRAGVLEHLDMGQSELDAFLQVEKTNHSA